MCGLLSGQGALRPFERRVGLRIGEVEIHPLETDRLAVQPHHEPPVAEDLAHRPVGAQDAEADAVAEAALRQRLADRGHHAGAVVRVDHGAEGGKTRNRRARRKAEDRPLLLGPDQLLRPEVPAPASDPQRSFVQSSVTSFNGALGHRLHSRQTARRLDCPGARTTNMIPGSDFATPTLLSGPCRGRPARQACAHRRHQAGRTSSVRCEISCRWLSLPR